MPDKDSIASINRELEEKEVIAQAKQMGMPYIDIANTPINIDLLRIVSEEDARAAMLMPFFRVGKKLRLAVWDPETQTVKDVLKNLRNEGYLLNLSLASKNGLEESFAQYKTDLIKKESKVYDNQFVEDNLSAYEEEIKNLNKLKEKLETSNAADSLNSLFVGAVKTGASDLHFEPYEQAAKVRFRIDGVMQDIFELQKKVMEGIIVQIKQKARLKLNVSDEPQDGRLSFLINDRKIDVRVSSIPTVYGESIVMRLLDSGKRSLQLKELGFEGRSLEIIKEASHHPNGIILSTGPTGSGKTTTLYSLLGILNSPERKIITLEDPVEYHVAGISQSQIDPSRKYTFAKGLRAILRQDPDVVMVGEIRDLETAEIAAQAAMTGHIVLSTL
ncbi:MAG: ATPase, T2SS/T4P/T4SS family, partial [Candidatus Gracilibacteria bacterium]|nr:ATPase, T2SS/T4P/T4SS family [Candidatus Gracilibacteria bacterium]